MHRRQGALDDFDEIRVAQALLAIAELTCNGTYRLTGCPFLPVGVVSVIPLHRMAMNAPRTPSTGQPATGIFRGRPGDCPSGKSATWMDH